MAASQQTVRALVLPLEGMHLILPSRVVLQVLSNTTIRPYSHSLPKWLIGSIVWQKQFVPVMAFELAIDPQTQSLTPPNSKNRVAIVSSLSHNEKIPCYAILLSGVKLPRPVQLTTAILQPAPATPPSPLIASQIVLEGALLSIPDLDVLQAMLMEHETLVERPDESQ